MSKPRPLTLFVTFHVRPSMIDEWLAAHRPVWDLVAAEPDLLLFDVFQLPDSPGTFRLVEVWDMTREAFERDQLTKPYYETLWERSRPTWEKEFEMEYYERFGEGASFRQAYLDGGKRVGK